MHLLARPTPDAALSLYDVRTGLLYYLLTSLVPVLGVIFGYYYVQPAQGLRDGRDLIARFANWDGKWYYRIAAYGYQYDPALRSSVAFFPAYPLLGRITADVTGLRIDAALLLVAHLCLAGAFILLAAYTRQRLPDSGATEVGWVLLAFGLWPTTCFFRFAYSEPLFLLCAIAVVYGMLRRWPLLVIALIVGLATATRPVGIALLLPFAWHVWCHSEGTTGVIPLTEKNGIHSVLRSPTRGRHLLPRAADVLSFGALACWGIAAYMAYQHAAFGDALAFAHTQGHWRVQPPVPLGEHVLRLLSLEPLWSVFNPASPCCWQRFPEERHPLFSLYVANPIYFAVALALLALGWRKRWLIPAEIALVVCLLAIPYATRSYENCMAGHGRFAAVAFPLYLVLGKMLHRLPPPFGGCLATASAFPLAYYAALFAAHYEII